MSIDKLSFRDFVNWAFLGLLALMAVRMTESVDRLNLEVAKVVAIVGQHEKRLDKLEELR